MSVVDKNLVLRMYNIPGAKTKNQLSLELTNIPIPFQKVVMSTATGPVIDARIIFNTKAHRDQFASYFTKMRNDLVIYKPLS